MGKASITIAVNAKWNGDQLAKAEKSIQRLATLTAATSRSTTSDLAKQGASWGELGGKIYNAGVKMEKVGNTLTKNVTTPIVTLGKYAANSAIEFDTAMANVRKTTNMSQKNVENLAQSALKLSKTQPVTADTLLNIEALGAQLGVSNDKLESFATTVSGLDIATNMDFETAGKEMAQFANITQMSQDKFQNYGSTIVDLGNHLATTEKDISSMALRLAGVTSAANFSQAEILGMAGAMSSLGIKSEAGGSAMTRIIQNISKNVANGSDIVSEYARVSGMSAEEFAKKWKEKPMEAVEALVQGLKRTSDSGEDMNVTLEKLGITNIRDSDTMRRLAGAGDLLKNSVDRANKAWGENTALTNEVDQRNKSLESRIQVLKNKVEAIAITIGRPLVEALLDAADAIQPLVDGIAGAANAFANADSDTQKMILGFVGVAAAAGPVLSTLGKVTQVVGTGVTAFGKAQQAAAVYGDALATTDGAQIRNYASASTMASNLGLTANKAVEAAGGAEKYVKAWEGMTESARKVDSLEKKLVGVESATKTAFSAAQTAVDEYNAALAKNGGAEDKSTAKLRKAADAANEKATALDNTRISLVNESVAAQDAFKENANFISSCTGSKKEAQKAAEGVDALSEVMNDVKVSSMPAASGLEKAAAGAKNMATGAASTVKGLAGMAGSFIAANAPMLIFTATIGLIGAAVSDWQQREEEARKHTELLANATKSADSIMAAASQSASSLGDAIGDVEVDADSTTQALADLNSSIGETFTKVATDSAKLDQYVSTIDELANKSGLSATEQWRLKEAVDGYNEVTGSAYKVTDALNGKIADGDGKLQDNTQALDDNAAAWKKNAEAQAYASAASKYMEQKVEATQKLQLATEKLNDLEDKRSSLQAKANQYAREAANGDYSHADAAAKVADQLIDTNAKVDEYKDKVSDLKKDVNSATKSEEYFQAAAAATAAGLDSAGQQMAGSIASAFAAMDSGSKTALSSMGFNITDLSVKLAQAGVSSDQLKAISSDNFQAMANSCGGSMDSLIQMIQAYNSTPVVNKDGSVTVDSSTLMFANGQVVTWNGSELVYKSTGASVAYGEVTDATGAVYEYNKQGLKSKSAKDSVDSSQVKDSNKNVDEHEKKKLTGKKAEDKVNSSSVEKGTKALKKHEDQKFTSRSVTDTANYKSVSNATQAMKNYQNQKFTNRSATLTVTTNYVTNGKAPRAAGGIRVNHADGGIVAKAARYHAHGSIVNNPGAGVPLDIVGEAGAEAIVPLTNRRYSKPFARTIAEQMGEIGLKVNGGNTYVLNINGVEQTGSARAQQLMEALFDEFRLTNQMGVA